MAYQSWLVVWSYLLTAPVVSSSPQVGTETVYSSSQPRWFPNSHLNLLPIWWGGVILLAHRHGGSPLGIFIISPLAPCLREICTLLSLFHYSSPRFQFGPVLSCPAVCCLAAVRTRPLQSVCLFHFRSRTGSCGSPLVYVRCFTASLAGQVSPPLY